jgi:3-oxoacyl-[acyl-carrier protein] reductase
MVAVNYHSSADEARELVARLTEVGEERAVALQADITRVVDIRRLFEQTVERFGRVDILVNNAGTGRGGPVAELTEEDFDAAFAVNTKGAFFCSREAARRMNDSGRIVNVSSTVATSPAMGMAAYAASKAALAPLTEVLAAELGSRGITANTVLPGPTIPGMFENAPPEERDRGARSSPLGRLGSPEDIAEVVAFLASERARWVTGQHLAADGGANFGG